MSNGITHTDTELVEAVLTGDLVRSAEVRDAVAQAMAAAGLGPAPARTLAEALHRVHGRATRGRPLTADVQRALDGAVEVNAAPVAVLGPWVARLRLRTFDEPRLGRLTSLVDAIATALGTRGG